MEEGSKDPVIFKKGAEEDDMYRFLENFEHNIWINCKKNVMRSHKTLRDWDMEDKRFSIQINKTYFFVLQHLRPGRGFDVF